MASFAHAVSFLLPCFIAAAVILAVVINHSVVDAGDCDDRENHDGSCAESSTTAIGDEKDATDYYRKASHYDVLWGEDNLHIGYYPHLAQEAGLTKRRSRIELSPAQAALALTEKMVDMAGISNTDRVLDLGSGKGLACSDIASMTGASCTGLELTPANVDRANELARALPDLNLTFFEGSFASIPDSVLADGPYDVVFSQVAFCHAHDQLDAIFDQALRAVKPNGIVVVNDYLGGDDDDPSEDTREHVYKRLHFTTLHGPRAWRRIADAAGGDDYGGRDSLELILYENLDTHMRRFYVDLAREAHRKGFVSTDGTPLGKNYEETVAAIERREIGMNVAVFRRRV